MTAPQTSTSGKVSAGWMFWRVLNRLHNYISNANSGMIIGYYTLFSQWNLYCSQPPRIRDDAVESQESQSQTEGSKGKMHRSQRLYLGQLEFGDYRFCCVVPGSLTNGRSIDADVEVRPRIQDRKVKAPFLHLVGSNKIDRKVERFAGNQQRLKEGND